MYQPMILKGVSLGTDNESCDTCTVRLMVTEPFTGTVELQIPEEVGAGFLPDEWQGTLGTGRELVFHVDSDMKVEGFRSGSYQRGWMGGWGINDVL